MDDSADSRKFLPDAVRAEPREERSSGILQLQAVKWWLGTEGTPPATLDGTAATPSAQEVIEVPVLASIHPNPKHQLEIEAGARAVGKHLVEPVVCKAQAVLVEGPHLGAEGGSCSAHTLPISLTAALGSSTLQRQVAYQREYTLADTAGFWLGGMAAGALHSDGVAAAKRNELPCRCKTSRCLKLYCSCFAAGKLCNSKVCLCEGCFNDGSHEDQRLKAMHHAATKKRYHYLPKDGSVTGEKTRGRKLGSKNKTTLERMELAKQQLESYVTHEQFGPNKKRGRPFEVHGCWASALLGKAADGEGTLPRTTVSDALAVSALGAQSAPTFINTSHPYQPASRLARPPKARLFPRPTQHSAGEMGPEICVWGGGSTWGLGGVQQDGGQERCKKRPKIATQSAACTPVDALPQDSARATVYYVDVAPCAPASDMSVSHAHAAALNTAPASKKFVSHTTAHISAHSGDGGVGGGGSSSGRDRSGGGCGGAGEGRSGRAAEGGSRWGAGGKGGLAERAGRGGYGGYWVRDSLGRKVEFLKSKLYSDFI